MSNKRKLLRAVARVFAGVTVKQFNEQFKGMSEESIREYIVACAGSKKKGESK